MLGTKFIFHENWYIVLYTYVNKHTLKKHKCQLQVGIFSQREDGYVSLICWMTAFSPYGTLAPNSPDTNSPSISYSEERDS